MKKLLSVKYGAGAFSFSMLVLRVIFGVLILAKHGFMKLEHFNTLQADFHNFMGLGSKLSLILVIFAEVICSSLIVLGLFTRLAALPLVIAMLVVIFSADAGKPFLESELALAYFAAFTTILFCGPGKISIDGMINK